MRILQATPAFFSESSIIGGGERYVHNVCAAVSSVSRDVRSDMLSFAPQRGLVSIGPRTNLHLIPGNPYDLPSFAGTVLDELIDTYDVIHLHQCLLPYGIFIAARARLAGKIVLGTDHGGGETSFLENYPIVGNMFDRFHADSNFTTASYRQLSTPITTILGPVDDETFSLGLGLRDHSLIVAVGRILPHKGYEHAIHALPKDAKLTIVGRVHNEDYFAFLKAKAVGKNVCFETGLDDSAVTKLMRRAGLYVHSGTHYGYRGELYLKPELLALAPLEAMCSGTPAIVSQAGALPELGQLGGCRSYADDAELATLLHQHLEGSLFEISPEGIRDDTVGRYGLKQFGEAYLKLINEMQKQSAA